MRIRHADPDRDAAACAAIYAPFVTGTAVSFEQEPPDAAAIGQRIERLSRTHAWLIGEDAEGVAGFAYAGPHRDRIAYRWAADVSVYVDERCRGRGVGRALYDALLALLARQGLRVACAGITLPNPASVALHEACGFEPVGIYRRIGWKAGAWRDVGWWQAPLGEPPDDGQPPEPGPPARLDQSSSSSSASVGQASAALRARPSSSGGTSASSMIG
jgi:phosphinothricin acetyltransferase